MFKSLRGYLGNKNKQGNKVKEEFQLAFNHWVIEVLELEESDFRRNHLNRFVIKDAKWFFNDYFDRKINRDAMDHSLIYVRDASDSEMKIFKSFQSIKENLR